MNNIMQNLIASVALIFIIHVYTKQLGLIASKTIKHHSKNSMLLFFTLTQDIKGIGEKDFFINLMAKQTACQQQNSPPSTLF